VTLSITLKNATFSRTLKNATFSLTLKCDTQQNIKNVTLSITLKMQNSVYQHPARSVYKLIVAFGIVALIVIMLSVLAPTFW
jgi:hypothetical protein